MYHHRLSNLIMRFKLLGKVRRVLIQLFLTVISLFMLYLLCLLFLPQRVQASLAGSGGQHDLFATARDVGLQQTVNLPPVGLNTHSDWLSAEHSIAAQSVAWGDVDGDGDLDLAVGNLGQNRIYLNQGRMLQAKAAWTSEEPDCTFSVAWGDMDRDGKLDLVVGNGRGSTGDSQCVGGKNKIYLNQGMDQNGKLQMKLAWRSSEGDNTQSIALGDVDGDGYLDLAVGNGRDCRRYEPCRDVGGERNRIYRNLGVNVGDMQMKVVWISPDEDNTHSVAWGDLNGDGYLDLAVGNGRICDKNANPPCRDEGGSNKVYEYQGWDGQATLTMTLAWTDNATDQTMAVAWGDVDGDGKLDLAVGNTSYAWSCNCDWPAPTKIYLNKEGTLHLAPWTFPMNKVRSLAWGDVDGDGDLDLAVGNWVAANSVYLNDHGVLQNRSAWEQAANANTTYSLAFGDMDGDGDLDLATGNERTPTQVYLNQIALLQTEPVWISVGNGGSVAWGDVDGDGDLDLAVGRDSGRLQTGVYLNQGGKLQTDADNHWVSPDQDNTYSVAWGDVDGDGDLDLAAGNYGTSSKIYLNQGIDSRGTLRLVSSTISTDRDDTNSVAWGDVDGDGDLDLAVGNGRVDYDCIWKETCKDTNGEPNKIYLNENGRLQPSAAWVSPDHDVTHSVAWGDMDGDGDLDLAVGNFRGQNKVYQNDGLDGSGRPQLTLAWTSDSSEPTTSVAWGDVDGDGDPDLAIGNFSGQNMLYLNKNGRLQSSAAWFSGDADLTTSIAWADVDGDGDLDLTAGNHRGPEKIYINQDGVLQTFAVSNLGNNFDDTWGIAWGDMDGDGDLDLAVGNEGGNPNKVYLNRRISTNARLGQASLTLQPYSDPVTTFRQPVTTLSPANFYAVPAIRYAQIIPITYTWKSTNNELASLVQGFYSLDGGGHWEPAVAGSGTITSNLVSGEEYVFYWDVWDSHLFGQSDNVVFRIKVFPNLRPQLKGVAGPYQWPYVSATTFPFRVRGTQVRVITDTSTVTTVANALIYRLPMTQTHEAEPLGGVDIPFHPDSHGYLQGTGRIALSDTLIALLPVPLPPTIAAHYTDTLRLYYTNAAITNTGNVSNTAYSVEGYTVRQAGVQTLTVSANHPLLLFDLDVALEWDAHNDKAYQAQLRADLQRTSELLYGWTNGQVALGAIKVYYDRQHWDDANIRILASNRLRPNSDQGGVVTELVTGTVKITDTPVITYDLGQVRMPVEWNRFGDADGNLGEDWPRTLSHELGHYLFFLYDNYLGFKNPENSDDKAKGKLISVPDCPGVMSNPYRDDEFTLQPGWPPHGCEDTLSNYFAGQADWTTIQRHYAWMITPTLTITGPNNLPLAVTQVSFEPFTQTATTPLAVPLFSLVDDKTGSPYQPSDQARAFLFASDHLIDLGSPSRDQVKAWGASPGQRLCVFDLPNQYFGCKTLASNTAELRLRPDLAWQPDVRVRPVNSNTVQITVTVPITGLKLHARLYPVNAISATAAITLSQSLTVTDGAVTAYTNKFSEIPADTREAYIHIWAGDPITITDTNEQIVTDFTIGGNPAYGHGHRPKPTQTGHKLPKPQRGSAGTPKNAPVLSDDGQALLLGTQFNFEAGQFYAFQTVVASPPPPPWTTMVGQAYRLISSTPDLKQASISLSYLSSDVPLGEENTLNIYYHADDLEVGSWQLISTTRQITLNTVIAPVEKPGLYALMSSTEIPLAQGWNLIAYPIREKRLVSEALSSLAETEILYSVICGYEQVDGKLIWKRYAPSTPDVNELKELQFGHGYWINMKRQKTLRLRAAADPLSQPMLPTVALNSGEFPPPECNPPTSPSLASAPHALASTWLSHIVQYGENWSVIAWRYGVSLRTLLGANPRYIRPGYMLYVGDRLSIPPSAR